MSTVGIDFGTTNSVLSLYGSAGPEALRIDDAPAEWEQFGFGRVMPSVFARNEDGTGHFGWSAKLSGTERFQAVKRLFATQQDVISSEEGTTFAVEEVATMLFAQLKASAAAQGVDAQRAVVTVPANSRGLARHRTKICGGMGGFDVLALINEPTAAAMAYAAESGADGQLLVFDWGGGTLDVTVLRATGGVFIEQASKGLPTRGGLDFDSRLRRTLLDTVDTVDTWSQEDRRELQQAIELAKIRLSRDESTVVQLPDGDTRKITRAMFEDSVHSLIEEARRPIERCLADLNAGPGAIDAVVMVGGTSNIPAVRDFVSDVLGQAPAVDVDPMTAVADGAAIAAGILTDEHPDNDFFVATEHALGTATFGGRVAEDGTPQRKFSVLIPRNHKLPARKTDTYSPVFADQEQVTIEVYEGDPDVPLSDPDNVVLKTWTIDLPGGEGEPRRPFEMTYHYDVDGVLNVIVTDTETGSVMLEDDVAHGVSADRRGLVEMAKRAKGVVEGQRASGRQVVADGSAAHSDPDAVQLLQRAHVKVMPFLDEDDSAVVRDAVDKLESAESSQLGDAKRQLEDALLPYSYLF